MSAQLACSIDAIEPAQALKVELQKENGTSVAVCIARDSDGSWHAIGDTCSHANISLSQGDVEDATIECWKHGAAFDLVTGAALSLPATQPVPVYPLEIVENNVYVDVDATL